MENSKFSNNLNPSLSYYNSKNCGFFVKNSDDNGNVTVTSTEPDPDIPMIDVNSNSCLTCNIGLCFEHNISNITNDNDEWLNSDSQQNPADNVIDSEGALRAKNNVQNSFSLINDRKSQIENSRKILNEKISNFSRQQEELFGQIDALKNQMIAAIEKRAQELTEGWVKK